MSFSRNRIAKLINRSPQVGMIFAGLTANLAFGWFSNPTLTGHTSLFWEATNHIEPKTQTPSDNPVVSTLDRAVDSAVSELFRNPVHVGLSLCIFEGGKSHFYNYGTTSKSVATLPSNKSLYEIASITKTFTGALSSRALIDGKMALDTDFRTYLREAYPNLEKNGKPITLRSLATHTSGLPKDIPNSDDLFQHPDFDKLPYQLIEREKAYNTDRYLRELHEVPLTIEPGAKTRYSNIGVKLISFGLVSVPVENYRGLPVEKYRTMPVELCTIFRLGESV